MIVRRRAVAAVSVGALALVLGAGGAACSGRRPASEQDAGVAAVTGAPRGPAPPSADAGGMPRPGMAWVPPGKFHAGTAPTDSPRVADEEMPGVLVEMGGFYIDLLPYPNEPNAIPTSNVTRDEAEQLCAQKGKRLCTELEWERACKGPEEVAYGHVAPYRAEVCGTGVPVERAALRPTGEHAQCKNGFGVAEMHGGPWEWTASPWGRGTKDPSLGVLRGGNSIAGELVGRCANAIGRRVDKKQPTMGLRCCAGARNAAEVELELRGAPGVEGVAPPSKNARAWRWTPVSNDELSILMTLERGASCKLVVKRADATLLSTDVGASWPELARIGEARRLRIRSIDARGTFSREITYVYGRVELGEAKRP